MSVVFFKGVGGASTATIDDTGSTYTGFCVKCCAKICVPIGTNGGQRRSQVVEWDSCGSTLVNAINNASDVLQFILNNTKGFLSMYTMQMGLYRPDVEGTPVDAGSLAYWDLQSTNAEDSSGNIRTVQKAVYPRLYIPFCKSEPTLTQITSQFQALLTAGKICQINFGNENKSNIRVSICSAIQGTTQKLYKGKKIALLTSIDTESGGADGVISKNPAS